MQTALSRVGLTNARAWNVKTGVDCQIGNHHHADLTLLHFANTGHGVSPFKDKSTRTIAT